MSTLADSWKVTYDGSVIAQVLSFTPSIDSKKVIAKALDGSIYIQTIGSGTNQASVTLFCSREEINSVNKAESEGAALSLVYREKQYVGYIEEPPEWEAVQPGYWYRATIKFLIEGEVGA